MDKRDTIMAERSGRFVLRTGPALHARLSESAREQGLSLNQHCVRLLAAAEGAASGSWREVTGRALEQFGRELVAIAIFGSVARGTARPSSDVDVLIVCAADVRITRQLYEPWDGEDLHWHGHVVEPHFVGLPARGARLTGLWAEVAMEGAVVFDPRLELSIHLAEMRRRIVAGELVRRTAQGHAYWSAA